MIQRRSAARASNLPRPKAKLDTTVAQNLTQLLKSLHFDDAEIQVACQTGKITDAQLNRLTEKDKILLGLRLRTTQKTLQEKDEELGIVKA